MITGVRDRRLGGDVFGADLVIRTEGVPATEVRVRVPTGVCRAVADRGDWRRISPTVRLELAKGVEAVLPVAKTGEREDTDEGRVI